MRLLIHVQHLLGTGHLVRAAAIARAAARGGLEVTLVSGGAPLESLDPGAARLVQLPPIGAAGDDLERLIDAHGAPLSEALKAERRQRLLALLDEVRPHVLVIEAFPFGRRAFRFELLPLLGAAWARADRPAVLVSVRDILTRRRPGRAEEAARLVRGLFDAVLVHGDPALVRFEESFPAVAAIADRLRYTGYVDAGPAVAPCDDAGEDTVVVSAGGGRVGEALFAAALAAAAAEARWRWHIVTGDGLARERFAALQAGAPGHVTLDRWRPDLRALMAKATVSVSQAGYNTVVDILSARARAVVVPFAREKETEQALRGARCAASGLVRCLDEAALTPARLSAEIASAAAGMRPPADAVDLGGAEASAAAIAEWAERAARGRMPT